MLDDDCYHFDGNVGPGVLPMRLFPCLMWRVEAGRDVLVVVEEEGQIVEEFGNGVQHTSAQFFGCVIHICTRLEVI